MRGEEKMPLPKPKKGENKDKFISRCVGNNSMNDEYPDNKQRVAVCNSIWERRNNNMEIHTNNIKSEYPIRYENYLGKNHMVVPVVIMIEGVHNGSGGPTLYTEEELSKFPSSWNGRPVPIYHPEDDGCPISCNEPAVIEKQSVGHLFRTFFEDGKLKSEAWIDLNKVQDISPETYNSLITGSPLEVSTGLFSDNEYITGEFNGEEYHMIAKNIRPDHLALLPGEVGACSFADGCGVRVNDEGGGSEEMDVNNINEDTQKEVVGLLESKSSSINTMRDFIGRDEFNEDATKELVGMLNKDVERNQMIKDLIGIKENNEGGEKPMKVNKEIKEKVDSLIENETTKFKEEDREWLETMEVCKLDKLVPEEKVEDEKVETATDEPVANITKEDAIKVLRETMQNPNQFMDLLPKEMKEQVSYGLKLHKEKRQELIDRITSNSDLTPEMFENENIEKLEAFANAVKPKTDFTVQAAFNKTSNDYEEDVLFPPGVKFDA